ncbi:MAG: dephospho-CoA kinase [Bifidobacteriaceae bacterium]|jgi:dephospho-CoA kinase|nr:dephospho-CoA kinase [Bifidobacteriaceae bacterium]
MTNYHFIRAAVTGPIASGKTTVCQQLQNKGSIIISWDKVYAKLLQTDEILQRRLRQAFLIPNNQVILPFLKKTIFNQNGGYNVQALKLLNSITHPIIAKKAFIKEKSLVVNYDKRGQQTSNPDDLYPLVVHEVPLLYQSHLDKKFDRIYICLTSNSTLLQRVMKRDKLTKSQAQARIDASQFNFPIHDAKVIVVNN